MLSRHRVLSVLMVSSLAVLAGCSGSSSDELPIDENDTGSDEVSSDAGDDTSTGDDTGGDDTGSDDTGSDDTGRDDTGTVSEAGDTGTVSETSGDTGTVSETGDTAIADTFVADTAMLDTAVVDTGTDTGTVADTGSAPTCATSTLATTAAGMPYPDKFVRQGFGTIYVIATGTNLDLVTAADLGPIGCTISSKTPTSLTAACNIAHGASLGGYNLTLTAPSGAGTCTAAVTIDRITSNATTGNDVTGRGTSTSPFKSVAKSLSVADAGDTVYLMAGVYGAVTGDTWTTTTTGATDPLTATNTLKAGVTVEGDAAGGTTLSGTDNRVAFRTPANVVLRNMTITGFRFGVATDKALTMNNVAVKNSIREGVYVGSAAGSLTMGATAAGSGATPSLCLLDSNYVGIHVTTGGKAVVTNCDIIKSLAAGGQLDSANSELTTTTTRFLDNGGTAGTGLPTWGKVGILAQDASKLTMSGGEVTRSFDFGLVAVGPATVSLTNTNINQNGLAIGGTSSANSGLSMQNGGSTTAGTMKVTGGTIVGNANFGVGVNGPWNVELTGTSITGNGNSGINFGSPGTLSAKGITVTDNTTLAANASNAAINITDGANASTKIEFLADGTTNTTISRTTPSTTIALVRDGRGFLATAGGTVVQFGGATVFQGSTVAAGTYVGGATGTNVNTVAGTQRAIRIEANGRRDQVL